MNRLYTIGFIFSSLSVIAGCAPSQQEFDTVVTTVQGSAKARQYLVNDCAKGWTPGQAESAGIILDVSKKEAPKLACARFVEGMKSGRITYADMQDIARKNYTPKLIKVMQGRG